MGGAMSDKKVREFWLDLTWHYQSHEGVMGEVYNNPKFDDLVHVREVIPGTITISRDELRAALLRAKQDLFTESDNTGGIAINLTSIERELFGEAK